MKDIVLVNHRSQAANKSAGITRSTFSLLEALIARGRFDFVLATTWSKQHLPQKLQDGLAQIITVDRPRPYSWNMVRQIFEDFGNKTGAAAILNVDQIGLVRGAKARLFIAHDLYFRVIPEALGLTDRLQQRFFIWPLMLRFNQRVACVSETTRNDIGKFYPAFVQKARVIGAGADLTAIAAERHPVLDTLKAPYLLSVGNVLPNKNVETLTQALDIVAQRGIALQAIHVGRDDRGLLRQAASHMRFAAPPVNLTGVSDAQLVGLYQNALCFVNTSLYEGFCLPVVEAQQAGTPVICSRAPAVDETAGEGAILFDPRSPAELAGHIQRLFANAEMRERLRQLGRHNALRHAWPKAAERLENLIVEMLAERR